ncbi:MAG: hypothetical protein J7539_16025 [Niabella sp.]|nr:hypothetical protein [Niabella sp.]
MYHASFILLSGVLLLIAISDIRRRQIALYYFGLLGIAVAGFALLRADGLLLMKNMLINSLLLSLMLGGLYFFYRMKYGKDRSQLFTKLGTGDLLFWLLLTPLFAPVNFLNWMIGSFTVCLLLTLALHMGSHKTQTIPLAGYQAIVLIIILCINQYWLRYNLFEENLFLPAL